MHPIVLARAETGARSKRSRGAKPIGSVGDCSNVIDARSRSDSSKQNAPCQVERKDALQAIPAHPAVLDAALFSRCRHRPNFFGLCWAMGNGRVHGFPSTPSISCRPRMKCAESATRCSPASATITTLIQVTFPACRRLATIRRRRWSS